jgi:hypothetical protein
MCGRGMTGRRGCGRVHAAGAAVLLNAVLRLAG